MRIVIDTNILVSGVFPRKIPSAVVDQKITVCATPEIINEYEEIVQEMINRKQRHITGEVLMRVVRITGCKSICDVSAKKGENSMCTI